MIVFYIFKKFIYKVKIRGLIQRRVNSLIIKTKGITDRFNEQITLIKRWNNNRLKKINLR